MHREGYPSNIILRRPPDQQHSAEAVELTGGREKIMTSSLQITATTFSAAFRGAYANVRSAFTSERWEEVWNIHNTVMLWQATKTYSPPEEIERSVLAEVAHQLGLAYQNGEPLRLDAVFSNSESWFPILVGIEHEYNCAGFSSEIQKLLSVRCPLKVGITYVYGRPATQQNRIRAIEEKIRNNFSAIGSAVAEDPRTEYLFLTAAEVKAREVVWYELHFRSSDGPGQLTFQVASQ